MAKQTTFKSWRCFNSPNEPILAVFRSRVRGANSNTERRGCWVILAYAWQSTRKLHALVLFISSQCFFLKPGSNQRCKWHQYDVRVWVVPSLSKPLKLGHFFLCGMLLKKVFFFRKTSQAEQHTFSWPGVSSSSGQLSLVTVNPLLQQNIIFKMY